MATSGTSSQAIEPLRKGANVVRWLQRFEASLRWQGVDDDRRKYALVSSLGADAYDLLADSSLPAQPLDKSYDELVALIQQQFVSVKLPIAARYEFYQLRQGSDDVSTYVRRLRRASEECDFGAQLDDRLRDQLVLGITNKDALKRLLTEKLENLNLDKAIDICTAYEAVQSSQKRLMDTSIDNSVCAIKQSSSTDSKWSRNPQSNDVRRKPQCVCCGKIGHERPQCRFKDATCHSCGKRGHLKSVCRAKPQVNAIQSEDDDLLLAVGKSNFHHTVRINGKRVQMVFDTGAEVSLINERVFNALGGAKQIPLQPRSRPILSYSGDIIPTLGQAVVTVGDGDVQKQLNVIVATGNPPCIYGCDWIRLLKPQFSVKSLQDFTVSLTLKENATPVFMKPRPLPYGLRQSVQDELNRMVSENVLVKVESSDWATPIVPVQKTDGRIRICGDYKATLNPHLQDAVTTTRPMEDIINDMTGSNVFTELDLRNAYHQLPLDEASSMLTTISTPFGLYRHAYLPFGVKSSPAIFQATMDKMLQGLSGVSVYQDNIYVYASTSDEHDERLQSVLERLKAFNFKVNESKCHKKQSELNVLGTIVNGKNIRPDPLKTKIIAALNVPMTVKELRSFLGMIEFYGRFIPNLSTIKEPLTRLTRSGEPFVWGDEQQHAFVHLKNSLCNATLEHFNTQKEVTLRCDASPVGCAAVLEQNGRPVYFVSKTLSSAERNYAQIQREALAIVWAVRRLHKYLIGIKFNLITDNKALNFLFHPEKPIPSIAAARIQRWALFLMGYNFVISHVKGEDNSVADCLSRYGNSGESNTFDVCNAVEYQSSFLLDKSKVHLESIKDSTIQALKEKTKCGWQKRTRRGQLAAYDAFRNEFHVIDDLLYRGNRLVIPASLQKEVLSSLHEGHAGSAAMKATARQCVWWLSINKDIEHMTGSCVSCCSSKSNNQSAWISWPAENKPWQRVHIDYAGPLKNGQSALVLIDAYSKWPEVHIVPNITSSETIKRLRRTFAQEGVPACLVSDNGPSLVSSEMEQWLSSIGCRHIRTPPYHPRSNGLAERFVRTLKEHLQASGDSVDLQASVDRFLLSYRNTPHSTTGEAPAALLKGHVLRTRITSMCASGDKLWVKSHGTNQPMWHQAIVVGTEGTRIARTQEPNGTVQRYHVEDTKPCVASTETATEAEVEPITEPSTLATGARDENTLSSEAVLCPEPNRPRRNINPPERYGVITYF